MPQIKRLCKTQFNGRYGRGFCEHSGQRIEKGRGFCRVYPHIYKVPPLRYVDSAEIASEWGIANKDVKDPSELIKLYLTFDLVKGFVPDYMHAILLGVTRQFVNL